MNLIILVSLLTLIDCRPQAPGTAPDNVQIEKQEVHLLKETIPIHSKLVNGSSQNILPESTIINNEQKSKVNAPGINPRSVQIKSHQENRNFRQHFQFPENPFYNPIFDYINRNPLKNNNEIIPQNIKRNNNNYYAVTHMNPKITQDDVIPGQYIKRKVTHQQTMIIPMEPYSNNMNYYSPNNFQQLPYQFSNQQQFHPGPQILHKPVPEDVKETLENQTIENVKNIVNTQFYPSPSLGFHNQFNPYPNYQNFPSYAPYSYGYPQPQQQQQQQPFISRMYPEFYQVRPNRQWQWPLAQYFPIIIKDPVQQIVNAFTSMVEYGEQANANCAPQPSQPPAAMSKEADGLNSPNESVNLSDYNSDDINAAFRTSDDLELPIESRLNPDKAKSMNVNNESEQSDDGESTKTVQLLAENDLYKNTGNFEPGKLAQKFNIHGEKNNDNSEKVKQKPKVSITKHVDEDIAFKNLESPNLQSNPLRIRPETKFFNPIGMQDKHLLDSNRQTDEIKIFSKDNTGNGIFIHKLKVNHGGVAIAGPGGVATAGHGGTAIVGPNGIAFTQPDSIAIAGVGAKVVAVNPNVNLTKLIESTGFDRNNFSSRIGKVVAIGPVIYYNKG